MKRILLGVIEQILLAGVLIGSLFVIFGDRITATIASNSTQTTKIVKVAESERKKTAEKANYDWSQVSSANVLSSLSAKISSSNVNPIALVTQPEAKVATTVVAGLDNAQLQVAAGTTNPNQKPGEGNYVLVAHHVPKAEWALFSGIYYNGEPGQRIYLTDLNKVYEYTIKEVKLVPDTAVEIVREDRWQLPDNGHTPGVPMLTMISCDVTGSNRITEYADLTNVYNFDKGSLPAEAVDGFDRAGDFVW